MNLSLVTIVPATRLAEREIDKRVKYIECVNFIVQVFVYRIPDN